MNNSIVVCGRRPKTKELLELFVVLDKYNVVTSNVVQLRTELMAIHYKKLF